MLRLAPHRPRRTDPDELDDDPGPLSAEAELRLPDVPAPGRRTGVPLVASTVPIMAAVGLWAVTGSPAMLWFAALGPLMALATFADGLRADRRDRRRTAADAQRTCERVARDLATRHAAERAAYWARTPDVWRRVEVDAHGVDAVWRASPDARAMLVVGAGSVPSVVRVAGGGRDAASAAVRRRATLLDDAPVTVPATGGIAVVGPEPLARAVVRGLVLQLCLSLPPDALAVRAPDGAHEPDDAWLHALPHARTRAASTVLAVRDPGSPGVAADIVVARVAAGAAPPPGIGAVLTLTGADRGRLVYDGLSTDVRLEGIGRAQADALAAGLADRAREAAGDAHDERPIGLEELLERDGPARAGGLDAVVGMRSGVPFRLDLVADGPHAVVAGITGSGKSELLTTWVAALCAMHGTDEVTFLLADFKGGTAFDALAGLPHVAGVITDLETDSAARALESLRAELRRREREIVRAGARDVSGTDLARLVIVVDEYAALAAAHPALCDLFTDIAARGRALGMHLILGTQRAAGTFREALLANCPLRISLRVTDPADSRVLIGTDDAAALSGASAQRGIALVRRAGDDAPHPVRIARTSARTVAAAAALPHGSVPPPPWLPPLPEDLPLAAARDLGHQPGAILLGVADEPDHQRRRALQIADTDRGLFVVGMAGSGRSGALETIAAQAPHPVWIGADPEHAWTGVAALAEHPATAGTVVLVDDVDALLAQFPPDYAHALFEHLERIIHAAGPGDVRVVLSAQRLNGAVGRLADLLPHRLVLAMRTPADAVAVGGAPAASRDRMIPGRGSLDGLVVQVAHTPDFPRPVPPVDPVWAPDGPVSGIVLPMGSGARRAATAARAVGARIVPVADAGPLLEEPDRRNRAEPILIVGDGEQWQRDWRVLQAVRAEHDLLVDAGCPTDYRLLTGDRALPPYCRPGRGRAWLIRDGRTPRRVLLAEPGATG